MPFEAFFSAEAEALQPSVIRRLTGLVNRPDVISFAAGSPNAAAFPAQELVEIARELVAADGGRIFQYSVTRGLAELIEAVRERMLRIQRIDAADAETVIVSGSQQGLDFVARVLLDPGDAAFVELPNYIGATGAFENRRARVYGVRKTAEGMDLDDLERQVAAARQAGSRPKLVYAIPNFQNPSGHTWSLARRRALAELAAHLDLIVFEDDAYGELYFPGVEPADLRPVKSFARTGRVVYMSTFSKILAPGLRLAWICGPAEIVAKIALLKETADLCSSTLSQRLTVEYLRRGLLEPHVDRIRGFYAERRDRMLAGLAREFAGLARWNEPGGGLFLWAELEGDVDAEALLERALAQEKVAFIPGRPFFVDGSGRSTLRLSFSNVSDENIDSGLARLSRLIRDSSV